LIFSLRFRDFCSSVTTANNITASTTINPEKLVCAKGSTNKFFTISQTGSNPTTVTASIILSPSTSLGATSAQGHLGGIGNTTFFKTGVTQVKPFNAQTGAFGTAVRGMLMKFAENPLKRVRFD
jgi:hypothetical protein